MSANQQGEVIEARAHRIERCLRVARDGMFSEDEAKAIVERIDRMDDHSEVRSALDNLVVALNKNGYDSTLVYVLLNSCAPAFSRLRQGRAVFNG